MVYRIAFLFELFRNSTVPVDTLVRVINLYNVCFFCCVFILDLLLQVVIVCAPCNSGQI